MSRIASLLLQLATLLAIIGVVLLFHDRIWGTDSIMMGTALLAVALTGVTTNQIMIVLRPGKTPQAVRKAPRPTSPDRISPTRRFTASANEDLEAQRKRERDERNKLNIAADLKRMKGEAEW